MDIINFAKLFLVCFSFLVIIGSAIPNNLLLARSEGTTDLQYSRIIRVKEDFMTIQEAINNASPGDTVLVSAGIYYEHVIVNKTVSLVGENNATTIIDGGNSGTVVQITANWVNVSGFKLQNSGWDWFRSGVETQSANNCRIENNVLFHTCHNIRLNNSRDCIVTSNWIDHVNQMGYGVRLTDSFNCTVYNNFIAKNIGGIVFENSSNCTAFNNTVTRNSDGIRLYSSSQNNRVTANTVFNNVYCGMIYPIYAAVPEGNAIFHNNFVNNTNPFIIQSSGNVWDDGYPDGGNFWSDYNGTDVYSGQYQNVTGNDGIGDSIYTVGGGEIDNYPLMQPWTILRVHNINTGNSYDTIQAAIDAPETLNQHILWISSGTYQENVNLYKSLTLAGENPETTILDGGNKSTVLHVNANNVHVVGLAICNSGMNYPPYGMDCGVLLNHTSVSRISNCLIVDNRVGLYLYFSQANTIENNVVHSNYENGVELWYSGNNTMIGNKISENSYSFGVFGGEFSDFNNSIDASNTVNGKPVLYIIGVQNEVYDNEMNIGVLYLINCNNITVQNLNLTRNGHGVFCYNVTDSRIRNVTASENSYGICLQGSSGDIISNSRCVNNWVGISLQESDYNSVESTIVSDCEKGISLYGANNNTLSGNTITDNYYGIRLFNSYSNRIFHNNLIENTDQADMINSYQNVWDNGFEGNYWSNYTGEDSDLDGIGNSGQTVYENDTDRFPLMGIFHSYDTSLGYAVEVISNSTIEDFQYFGYNQTIMMRVSNMTVDQAFGFCRLRIPYALISGTFHVTINGTEPYYWNYSVFDDGENRWIYFLYQHSTNEILVIPEIGTAMLVSIIVILSILYSIQRRTK